MERLNWFKFDPTKWLTGRINRAPANVQVSFLRLCCIYWVEECNMDAERAELECGEEEYQYLLKYKIIKQLGSNVHIDFLDDNMDEVMATSKKNSVNAALGWQKRKVRKEAIAMPNDAVAMRSHKVAMPNHAEEKRREEKREEEKRKEEKREEDKWFNVFWDSFGKKQDLQKCQAKWSKLNEKEKNAALDKVAAYVHSTPDVQFRKNPLTWLNGKCWEDEIIIPTLNTKISNFEKAVKADLHSMIIYDNDNE
jgi:hypothetical protein